MLEHPSQSGQGAEARHAQAMIGRVISQRYRVDELLAMGGMGAVYAGTHVHMHKRVAIKILHPRVKRQPELVQRFEREAIAGAHIQHPNVAAATDFGELEEGSYFLILEYVQGTTLADIVRRGPLPYPRALLIARQIAAALEATHAMGIVHRDLKPLNVMVAEAHRDWVKLIDFGFAKVPVERLSGVEPNPLNPRRHTALGVVFGSIAYLAPEAASGMQQIGPRSDLYALGLIVYEMLAGRHPFQAVDPVELFKQQMHERPAPLARHGVRVPPALEALVMRLLDKDPAARPESAAEVIDAIDELCAFLGLASAPETSYTPPAGYPSRLQPSSRPPAGYPSRPQISSLPPTPAQPVYRPSPTPLPPAAWDVAVPPPPPPPALVPLGATEALRRRDRITACVAFGVLLTVVALLVVNLRRPRAPVAVATAGIDPPIVAFEPPPEPPVDTTRRAELVDASKLKAWDRAADAVVYLANRDPASFRDRAVAGAARDAAIVAARAGGERASRVFDALARDAGPEGLDVLYDVLATRGNSAPAERAAALLRNPEVVARGTAALRIAFDLRDAPCKEKLDLLDRAVEDGDRRALIAMETVVRFCYAPNARLLQATQALRDRLKRR